MECEHSTREAEAGRSEIEASLIYLVTGWPGPYIHQETVPKEKENKISQYFILPVRRFRGAQ